MTKNVGKFILPMVHFMDASKRKKRNTTREILKKLQTIRHVNTNSALFFDKWLHKNPREGQKHEKREIEDNENWKIKKCVCTDAFFVLFYCGASTALDDLLSLNDCLLPLWTWISINALTDREEKQWPAKLHNFIFGVESYFDFFLLLDIFSAKKESSKRIEKFIFNQ